MKENLRAYISNVKWLFLTIRRLQKDVANRREVIAYYLSPIHRRDITVRFRNGIEVTVFKSYPFEAIAETNLLDVYDAGATAGSVIVDVGASVGDSVLYFASKVQHARIYAFEPDVNAFAYLKSNLASNSLWVGKHGSLIHLFNTRATANALRRIFDEFQEATIDFLKIDCEGCEYDLLLPLPNEVLKRIRRISLELHYGENHSESRLTEKLRSAGFHLSSSKKPGQGAYLYAFASSL